MRSGGVGEGHELGALNDGSDGFIGSFFGEFDGFNPVLRAGLVCPLGSVFSCCACFCGVGKLEGLPAGNVAHSNSDIAEGVDDSLFVIQERIGHLLIGEDIIGVVLTGVSAAVCGLSWHKWMMPQGEMN